MARSFVTTGSSTSVTRTMTLVVRVPGLKTVITIDSGQFIRSSRSDRLCASVSRKSISVGLRKVSRTHLICDIVVVCTAPSISINLLVLHKITVCTTIQYNPTRDIKCMDYHCWSKSPKVALLQFFRQKRFARRHPQHTVRVSLLR